MSESNEGIEDETGSLSDSEDCSSEVTDIENDPKGSDSKESVSSKQMLFDNVATGGVNMQTNDGLITEHLSNEIHASGPSEILKSAPHDCQIKLDDENSQLANACTDNSDFSEKDVQSLEAFTLPEDSENNSSLSSFNKGENNSVGVEGATYAGNKMKETSPEKTSSTEKQEQTSQVTDNALSQIFKLDFSKLDSQREKLFLENNKNDSLKYPDYESDEFSDVEDSTKECSSDSDSSGEMKMLILQEQDAVLFPGGTDLDETANHSTEAAVLPPRSESLKARTYNTGASCSHAHDRNHELITGVPGPSKSKQNIKLPTIPEVFSFYDEATAKDVRSSRSKPSPLKMKAKVGMRKDRCNVCRKRLGLTAIKCRCGGYYCAKHRYDKDHNCTFDYKAMGAEEIRKNNPRVIAEKVRKL